MKRFQGVSDDVIQNLRRDVVQGEACGEKQSRFVFEVATDEVSRVVVTLKVSETQRKKEYIYEVDKDSWFSDAKSDSNESSIRGNKSASQSQTEWFKTSCTRIESSQNWMPDRENSWQSGATAVLWKEAIRQIRDGGKRCWRRCSGVNGFGQSDSGQRVFPS